MILHTLPWYSIPILAWDERWGKGLNSVCCVLQKALALWNLLPYRFPSSSASPPPETITSVTNNKWVHFPDSMHHVKRAQLEASAFILTLQSRPHSLLMVIFGTRWDSRCASSLALMWNSYDPKAEWLYLHMKRFSMVVLGILSGYVPGSSGDSSP